MHAKMHGRALHGASWHGTYVEGMPQKTRRANLCGPGALDKVRVEDLLPSMEALHICPVIEVLRCAASPIVSRIKGISSQHSSAG